MKWFQPIPEGRVSISAQCRRSSDHHCPYRSFENASTEGTLIKKGNRGGELPKNRSILRSLKFTEALRCIEVRCWTQLPARIPSSLMSFWTLGLVGVSCGSYGSTATQLLFCLRFQFYDEISNWTRKMFSRQFKTAQVSYTTFLPLWKTPITLFYLSAQYQRRGSQGRALISWLQENPGASIGEMLLFINIFYLRTKYRVLVVFHLSPKYAQRSTLPFHWLPVLYYVSLVCARWCFGRVDRLSFYLVFEWHFLLFSGDLWTKSRSHTQFGPPPQSNNLSKCSIIVTIN